MCLILLAWQAHPVYRLVLAANRDERHARPSLPADWWPQAPDVGGGRDLAGGGTWLGITRQGRFAALTNHRNLRLDAPSGESRGGLVADFLTSQQAALPYVQQVSAQRTRWAPFNLLASSGDQLIAYGSAGTAPPQVLRDGVHGLSNHLPDTPWPKVVRGSAALHRALDQATTEDALCTGLFALLDDRQVAADADLPDTGLPLPRERALSAAMIVDPDYGTRCATVLLWRHDGTWMLQERSFDCAGTPTIMRTLRHP